MVFGGLFLSWGRPSREQQKNCIAAAGDFNYDAKLRRLSSDSSQQPADELEQSLSASGFFINRSRVLLGSGPATFHLAKSALLSWKHFGLGWAFVDSTTPVTADTKLCVCVKEVLPWLMMPLKIAYLQDVSNEASRTDRRKKGLFGFGSGTLQGHLLAGEERFSIEWDENDQVWYEIFSFSKPAHLLSAVGYPYVQLRQKHFAQQSTNAVLKHVSSQQPSV